MVSETYPRNLVGYGRLTPDPKWPDEARVAVQFVINYEEGGESSILDGDPVAAVVLLANLAALAPRGLCAGDVVTTGSCTGAIAIPGAGEFEADFGTLGSVRLRVS